MRVYCSYDEDFGGQHKLWQANCRRSINGRKGQRALREMEQALLSMPVKHIYRDVLVDSTGEVCAIGAMMVQQHIDVGMSREQAIAACCDLDPSNTEEIGVAIGIPRMVAWSIAVENDDEWHIRPPKRRYEHLLSWVQERIQGGES